MEPGPVTIEPLPMGLNRISWKQSYDLELTLNLCLPLPMGLNRISWKRVQGINLTKTKTPYRWV